MLIETILKDKGGDVLTISDSATLLDAAKMLDQKRIVRRFARNAGATTEMTVADAMTRGVITASPAESVDTCLGRMTDRRIRHLPVVEKGKLRGIISIGDLVKYKIDSVLAEAEAMTAYIKSG